MIEVPLHPQNIRQAPGFQSVAEIGISLPNNQHQHRTLQNQQSALAPHFAESVAACVDVGWELTGAAPRGKGVFPSLSFSPSLPLALSLSLSVSLASSLSPSYSINIYRYRYI